MGSRDTASRQPANASCRSDAHVGPNFAAELVVDEVPQLVEEAERDPAVAPRDAEIDWIAVA